MVKYILGVSFFYLNTNNAYVIIQQTSEGIWINSAVISVTYVLIGYRSILDQYQMGMVSNMIMAPEVKR